MLYCRQVYDDTVPGGSVISACTRGQAEMTVTHVFAAPGRKSVNAYACETVWK